MSTKPPVLSYLMLVAALILPIMAVIRITQSIDTLYMIAYVLGISMTTVILYGVDKRKAETTAWRIPESTLHMAELLGGWTAAFAAQRIFRHKISKTKYQIVFWLIALLHQCLAYDYLHGWTVTRAALPFLEPALQ